MSALSRKLLSRNFHYIPPNFFYCCTCFFFVSSSSRFLLEYCRSSKKRGARITNKTPKSGLFDLASINEAKWRVIASKDHNLLGRQWKIVLIFKKKECLGACLRVKRPCDRIPVLHGELHLYCLIGTAYKMKKKYSNACSIIHSFQQKHMHLLVSFSRASWLRRFWATQRVLLYNILKE